VSKHLIYHFFVAFILTQCINSIYHQHDIFALSDGHINVINIWYPTKKRKKGSQLTIMSFIFQQNSYSKRPGTARQEVGSRPRSHYLLSLLTLVVFLVSCGSNPASPEPSGGTPTQVKFALDYLPNANDTGLYVAQAKGWYKQQGINLTILPYSSNVSPEQLVSSGQADFGISFAEALTENRALKQPMISVAAIFQHDTSALVSLKKSGLDSIGKLAGKRYAGYGAAWEQPLISQILSCRGASDGTFQNVATDLDPVAALQSGKFDFAIMEQGFGVVQAKFAGVDLNVFPFNDNCVPDMYEVIMISNEPFLKAHPDVARRFMTATAQGYTYAAQHPQEAADILIASAPKGTFPDLKEIHASQEFQSAQYINDGKCWGVQTLKMWTDYPRFMSTHHAIVDAAGKPITTEPNYAAAFTNNLLPSCS
jgi:ABC-type nitrate/sulfonate/bicarbonate transport system substrate-binding protein